MKQLLLCFSAFVLILACNDDDNATTSSESSSTTSSGTSTDTASTVHLSAADSSNKQLSEYEEVPKGKSWVEHYIKLVHEGTLTNIKDVPQMIWLSEGHANGHVQKAKKIKICMAVDPDDKSQQIIALIQVHLKTPQEGKNYKYYKLKKSAEVIGKLETGFCPQPYPCSQIEPVEAP